MRGEIGRRDAEMDRGIEQACPVEMNRDAAFAGDVAVRGQQSGELRSWPPAEEIGTMIVNLLLLRAVGRPHDPPELTAELLARGAADPRTAAVTRVLYPPPFPVDVRHNSKIDRPALGRWAEGRL